MLTAGPPCASFPPSVVVRATRHGLLLAPDLDLEAGRTLVAELVRLARSAGATRHTTIAWLGDVLVAFPNGARGWITECATAAGIDPGSLRNAKMVCTRIPVSCRHDGLSWTHHCEVGLMFADPIEIERWLSLAEAEGLSTADLRKRIRAHVASAARPTLATPEDGGPEIFALMRELRAAARMLDQRREIWNGWPLSAARLAIAELGPIAEFVDAMRASAINADRPRDLSNN